jgi:hypothetical protein
MKQLIKWELVFINGGCPRGEDKCPRMVPDTIRWVATVACLKIVEKVPDTYLYGTQSSWDGSKGSHPASFLVLKWEIKEGFLV